MDFRIINFILEEGKKIAETSELLCCSESEQCADKNALKIIRKFISNSVLLAKIHHFNSSTIFFMVNNQHEETN